MGVWEFLVSGSVLCRCTLVLALENSKYTFIWGVWIAWMKQHTKTTFWGDLVQMSPERLLVLWNCSRLHCLATIAKFALSRVHVVCILKHDKKLSARVHVLLKWLTVNCWSVYWFDIHCTVQCWFHLCTCKHIPYYQACLSSCWFTVVAILRRSSTIITKTT